MSREHDWKIHEYMGNDLTGWRWETVNYDYAIKIRKENERPDYQSIPHYSTTWEGAGLVIADMQRRDFDVTIEFLGEVVRVQIGSRRAIEGKNAPLALCKAYISAMEERK
jgi:hypothetical protein